MSAVSMLSLRVVRPSALAFGRPMRVRCSTFSRPAVPFSSRKVVRDAYKQSAPIGRKSVIVSASDDADKVSETPAEPVAPAPEVDENVPGFSARTADGKELTVGPVGTALLWALLIVLFGLSLFFTNARAFLPDLEGPAIMDEPLAYINLINIFKPF
uniref:Uncharacterized protein n=1 Tax=Pyramimonas obovata TaxID=1411642 RepID=A0A7S0WTX4_9CHLO|mmetsp:Transcript_39966/g.86966  ORF Transcript_39966/g.86966 Transcript_39966/m.86966 type:complete len:157 (+) Transcript_39966:97-567(+)|eukprot:CAMPEP_0118921608 /NCGR_PEP_ID=MMETSP1169-20130426/827_1 /TAXON_ID=36882 /ORGANISM="Pyramimonas obovata, Strain CCMP722" /LENGTH=156 /DNA_ID=CAMNT_0006862359 /DNA_START=91 /DNA_END=561 /DNA_ORIENTATION=+